MDIEREVVLPTVPQKVWEALTADLGEWFGASADLDPRPGRTSIFSYPDGTEERAMVEACDPGRRLVLRWLPFARGPDGQTRHRAPTRVVFVLDVDPDGTRLRVTEERLDVSGPDRLQGVLRR